MYILLHNKIQYDSQSKNQIYFFFFKDRGKVRGVNGTLLAIYLIRIVFDKTGMSIIYTRYSFVTLLDMGIDKKKKIR